MKKIFVLLFIFLAFNINGVEAEFSDSNSPESVEAKQQFQKADKELNDTYNKILKEYSEDKLFISKFKEAQRAWLKYRDLHLESLYPKEDKFSEYGSVYVMCSQDVLTEMTTQRTKEISVWLQGVDEGEVCAGSVKRKDKLPKIDKDKDVNGKSETNKEQKSIEAKQDNENEDIGNYISDELLNFDVSANRWIFNHEEKKGTLEWETKLDKSPLLIKIYKRKNTVASEIFTIYKSNGEKVYEMNTEGFVMSLTVDDFDNVGDNEIGFIDYMGASVGGGEIYILKWNGKTIENIQDKLGLTSLFPLYLSFEMRDINNDGKKEMIVSYGCQTEENKNCVSVLGFKDGKYTQLGDAVDKALKKSLSK